MTLVEQALRRFDDRRDDPRLRHDAADRAHRTATRPLRDLADLQLQPSRACERIATLVHRCRAGVRSLPSKGDLVTLHAERPQDDPQRQVHRLEHRPLLDVQLQVRRRALELRAGVERRVQVDAMLGDGIGQGDAVRVLP